MSPYNDALDTPASLQAKELLLTRFKLGEGEQVRLLKQVSSMVIKDRLLSPKDVVVLVDAHKVYLSLPDKDKTIIHSHALGQLCDRANPKVPRGFFRSLVADQPAFQHLAQTILNDIYFSGAYGRAGQTPKFMGRFVQQAEGKEELRGFVSQYFARHRASLPMLRGFVHACTEMRAKPISARVTDLHFSLKSFLPYVFEPIPRQFIGFGVEWSNSDFADGSLKVALCTQHIHRNTAAVIETSWSKTHLGSIVKESDLQLGANAQAREVEALIAIMSDAVKQVLQPENINKMLLAIEEAAKQEIPWHRLKSEMGRILRDKELSEVEKVLTGEAGIEELPPVGFDTEGNPLPTRWWASEVTSFLATKEVDPVRQTELEKLAGTLLKAS